MYLEVSFTKKTPNLERRINELAKKFKMDSNAHYETGKRKNVAVFVTKEPHCLDAILKVRKSLKCKISVIIGTENTLALTAKKAGVPFVLIKERKQEKAESQIISACNKYSIDLILLARYMRILTPNFVWRYPNRIINIHPSLLPAFPGAADTTTSRTIERNVDGRRLRLKSGACSCETPYCIGGKRRYFVFLHNRLEISCAKSASVDTGKCAPCCSMEPIGITAMRFLSVSLRSSESNPSITLDIYITF